MTNGGYILFSWAAERSMIVLAPKGRVNDHVGVFSQSM